MLCMFIKLKTIKQTLYVYQVIKYFLNFVCFSSNFFKQTLYVYKVINY